MVKLNEEYFNSPYYFYLKDKGEKIAIYYSVSSTITESRKNEDVVIVDKEIFKDIQRIISNILSSNKKLSKEYIHNLLDKKSKSKSDGELDELVNPDGSLMGSSVPILNQRNLAKKTMDQTVRMSKSNQFPFIRVYYGEGKESEKTISEVDQSESFGFEETEYAPTYNVANKIMKNKLDVEDPIERDERLKRFGFDKNLDRQLKNEKKRGRCKNCFTKRRLSELEKQKMETMIDEIILSKKSRDREVVKKPRQETNSSDVMSKLLMRNIEAIKKLADKEDISIDKLVKHLKTGE